MELLLPTNDSPARPGSPRGPVGRTQSWGSPLTTICQCGAELRMGGAQSSVGGGQSVGWEPETPQEEMKNLEPDSILDTVWIFG